MSNAEEQETSAEVYKKYSSLSSEAESSEIQKTDEPSARNGDSGFKFLHSLMTATLFSDYFVHHANISYGHETRAERVTALREKSPKFYVWCRNLDVITRGVLWLLVVAAASITAAGTAARLFFS